MSILLTLQGLLAIAAFVIVIAHAMNKSPLWPAVLLLAVALLTGLGLR